MQSRIEPGLVLCHWNNDFPLLNNGLPMNALSGFDSPVESAPSAVVVWVAAVPSAVDTLTTRFSGRYALVRLNQEWSSRTRGSV